MDGKGHVDDRAARKILEKAIERGVISQAHVHETLRRQEELAAKGTPRPLLDLLREVSGLGDDVFAALDDRSLLGRTLGGFQVEAKIGEGGMGAVYRATQVSLGRAVALKVLDPFLASRAERAARFRREARAAAKLDHAHVVQPIDFGEDSGFLFFAMEYMEGGSAVSRVLDRGPCSAKEALEIGIAMAKALEYAQERGLVHRDLKPDNILFSRQGTPKLADLGLVLEREDAAPITEPGALIGTLHYMSPEQARGVHDLDGRSDIYSLGVTLYELLCGAPPFEGSAVTILFRHISEEIPDVRAKAPQASEHLAAIIRKMTAKAREDRYQSARELREALELAAAGAPAPAAMDLPVSPELPTIKKFLAPAAHAEREARSVPERGAREGVEVPPVKLSDTTLTAQAPPRRSRAPVALAGLAAAGLAVAAWLALAGGRGTAAVDPAAETAAANRIREIVLVRCRGTDTTPGLFVGTDPWTTAQACAALAIAEPPPSDLDLASLLEYLRRSAVRGPEGRPLGWGVVAEDPAACTEVTGWVGIAYALAGTPEDRERARRALLATQQEDGAFPSIPAAGAVTVRASGTAIGLAALVLLEAAGPSGTITPIERAARWLGARYERSHHAWFPNPRAMFGNRDTVHGLSEFVSWALLEAEALLEARSRGLPAEARDALADYAAHLVPQDLPVTTVGVSYLNDYLFDLAPAARSSLRAPRWIWAPWRLLACERIARSGGLPRAAEWAAEGARLRARLPQLAAALAEAPTFQVCEVLFGVSALRSRPPGDAAAGSLVRLLGLRGRR